MVYSIVNNWVVQHLDTNPGIRTLDEIFEEIVELADQNSEQATDVEVHAGFILNNGEELGPMTFSCLIDYIRDNGWGRWYGHHQAKLAGWRVDESTPFIVCGITTLGDDYTWIVEQLNSASYSEFAKFYQIVNNEDAVILKQETCKVKLI